MKVLKKILQFTSLIAAVFVFIAFVLTAVSPIFIGRIGEYDILSYGYSQLFEFSTHQTINNTDVGTYATVNGVLIASWACCLLVLCALVLTVIFPFVTIFTQNKDKKGVRILTIVLDTLNGFYNLLMIVAVIIPFVLFIVARYTGDLRYYISPLGSYDHYSTTELTGFAWGGVLVIICYVLAAIILILPTIVSFIPLKPTKKAEAVAEGPVAEETQVVEETQVEEAQVVEETQVEETPAVEETPVEETKTEE